MNPTATRAAVLAAAVMMLLSTASCVHTGERVELVDLRTEDHTVELGGAERVVVDVEIGIGKLTIRGGSSALMDAEFTCNVEEWMPVVEYHVEDGLGVLSVSQPNAEGKSAPKGARNEWTVTLSEDVPMELSIDMGVGEAGMDLGDLELTDLSVDHGVGDIRMNLAGKSARDLSASIDGGVGSIDVTVPSSVGVRLDGDTGIGSFRTHGLTKRGDVMVNDAYGETEVTIRLSIDAGIGEIRVETDDGRTDI